jgi:hypothetical protein
MLGYPRLEDVVRLSFEYAERWKLGRRPVFLVKAREVKALMKRESVIGNDLHSKEVVACIRGQ